MAAESEESLTKQVLNIVLENNALRDTVFPYMVGWMCFNVLIMCLLLYITFKLSFST
jgi:hypothetical protein